MNLVQKELIRLIIENPELKIMPAVAEDCICDFGRTIASVTEARIDEYVVDPYDNEICLFRSDSWKDRFEDEYYDHDPKDRLDIPDKEIEEAYNALPWTKVLILMIDAYDEEEEE
jgi:hypothetical protein